VPLALQVIQEGQDQVGLDVDPPQCARSLAQLAAGEAQQQL